MTTQPAVFFGAIAPASTGGIQALAPTPEKAGVWQWPGYEIAFAAGVSSIDTTAPTITAVSPTPGALPGAVGGFSSDFTVAKTTPIVINVTDAAPGIGFVYIVDGSGAVVFADANFQGAFVLGSSRQAITSGSRYNILPTNLWSPGADLTQPTFVTLKVFALDSVGNLRSTTYVYQLPAAANAIETAVEVDVPTGARDMTAAMLNRVCEQFRGNA